MKDFDDASSSSTRTFYFLGNSVTRTYAFILCDILSVDPSNPDLTSRTNTTTHDRHVQKRLCGDSRPGTLGEERPRGCKARCGVGAVVFAWKNTLSSYLSSDFRDICDAPSDILFEGTASCLRRIFRRASENDVLVVGSIGADDRYFGETGHLHFQSLDRFGELALRASENNNIGHVGSMLRLVFPGKDNIVWHSYPALDTRLDTKGRCASLRCDLMYAKINERTSESLRDSGVSFVSVWHMQSERLGEYDDMIHHGGRLGRDIVERLLSVVSAEASEAKAPYRSFLCPLGGGGGGRRGGGRY